MAFSLGNPIIRNDAPTSSLVPKVIDDTWGGLPSIPPITTNPLLSDSNSIFTSRNLPELKLPKLKSLNGPFNAKPKKPEKPEKSEKSEMTFNNWMDLAKLGTDLFGGYLYYRGLGIAEDELDFTKSSWEKDYAQRLNAYNMQVADAARNRVLKSFTANADSEYGQSLIAAHERQMRNPDSNALNNFYAENGYTESSYKKAKETSNA